MKTQSTVDRISELPDEILRCILRRMNSPRREARTIVLSRRWRDLWRDHWRSCPAVIFDDREMKAGSQSFEKFCKSTISRFSKDGLLRMETLKLSLSARRAPESSHGKVPKLLDLASKRKAEEVEIDGLSFPLRAKVLTNLAVKVLKLGHLNFYSESSYPPLSLNSLRFLRLDSVGMVDFYDDPIFENLIGSSPLLETLELVHLSCIGTLVVSAHLTKLKTLEIIDCGSLWDLKIAAPGLETLRVRDQWQGPKLELAAPRLNLLDISNPRCTAGELAAVISNLQSLKSLTLIHPQLGRGEKKLKLSNPELEEFTLHAPELEEIVLDAGPHLTKFTLRIDDVHKSINVLNKCEISPACRWELDFKHKDLSNESFAALKSFVAKFAQFNTVDVTSDVSFKATFEEEKVGYIAHSMGGIKHLKVLTNRSFGDAQKARLNGLLWALSPKFLTIIFERSCYSVSSLHNYLKSRAPPHPSQKGSRGKKVYKNRSWRDRVKDVAIVSRDIDRSVVNEVGDQVELKDVLKSVAKPATQDQVCFMLTWG